MYRSAPRFASPLRMPLLQTSSLVLAVLAAGSLAAALAPTAARAQEEKKADLPIKRVVIFSSGVSFYEHSGSVEGNAKVDMTFNVRDVNDLLKSMVLQDLGGGRISTVSYASKDPITRTLRTFSIDLTQNPTLADLLGQIRGEAIEIDAPTKIAGTIVGVEQRKQPSGKDGGEPIEVSFLNLLTDDGLRSVSLENVGRIKLTNAKLDAELRQALAVLAASKSMDKKTVTLNFLGAGERQVRVGYIQESPIWKTSYRLVLDDEGAPLLQGWAIVENTTEADWNEVGLTLVSGRPISFIMDLYQPLYVSRPVVMPELYASLRPRTYDQDLAAADGEFRKAAEQAERLSSGSSYSRRAQSSDSGAAPPPAPGAPAFGGLGGYAAGGEGKQNEAWNLQQGVQSVAQAGDVGELFRYVIATPVTLERSRSAMLPIVNESVEGEKVSIYNQSVHAKHPLNGLRLKNSTDLHLMQGPITVFDGGAYAGDAQIQDLPPASERLISYAMDLDTEVAPEAKDHPTQLVSCRMVKGVFYTSHKYTRTRMYTIKNSGSKAKKVLVEYPVDANWTLVEPKEPSEKTRDLYRFAVSAEPGKPAKVEVTEEQTVNNSVAVTNMDDNSIRIYLNSQVVSDEVKAALQEVVKRKLAIELVVRQRQEFERQISIIGQEQERIRNNMKELPRDSELYRRYVAKFTEQEDSIENLRTQVTSSIENETKLRKGLDDYLIALDLS